MQPKGLRAVARLDVRRHVTRAAIGPALIVLAVAFLLARTVHATPTPLVTLINHETRQCSEVIQGDDCSWCEPPADWQVLGAVGAVTCPEDYALVSAPEMDCRRYETPFCCSGGAHRGDCEDLVIDQDAAICAFVEEIEGCALPANWQRRPAEVAPQIWACPPGYGWAEQEVACEAAATPGATEPVAAENSEETWRGICFGLSCLVFAALLFGLAAMFPVWYAARQKERRTQPPLSKR